MLCFTNLIIQVQAIKPLIKAAIKPRLKVVKSIDSEKISPPKKSFAIFPKIRERPFKNEKLDALLFPLPKITKVKKLSQLLKIQERIQTVGEIQKIKNFASELFFLVFFHNSATKIKNLLIFSVATPTQN